MELYGLYGIDFYYISFRNCKKVKFGLVSFGRFRHVLSEIAFKQLLKKLQL